MRRGWWWWRRRRWGWTDRGGAPGTVAFWSDRREGKRLLSSLTCIAVLDCITQSSPGCQWRGRGQMLTTAKESSRSERVRDRGRKWARESASVQRCSELRDSAYSTASAFLLSDPLSLHSAACCPSPYSSSPLFTSSSYNLSFSFLLLHLHSTFHSSSLTLSLSPLFASLFLLANAVGRFFFFLKTIILSSSPYITSHGHPCILQVRVRRVRECRQTWRVSLRTTPGVFGGCRSPWSIQLVLFVLP